VILVDTGAIVAVVNDRDDHHQECKYLLERLPGPLPIPATVATEVCVMLERRRAPMPGWRSCRIWGLAGTR
jgi:predicted nucleic acid-binding protein